MVEFKSKPQIVDAPVETVFAVLSDFNNLRYVGNKFNAQNLVYEKDTFSFTGDMGTVYFRMNETVPCERISVEMTSKEMPAKNISLHVYLREKENARTELVLTSRMDIPDFFKVMISSKINGAIDSAARMLLDIPYNEIMDANK
jgi:hypothetical protein